MLQVIILVVFVGGFAFYYLNIYKKGKAAGGGFMAGVQASHQEKWKDQLEPGEELRTWGTGMLWRPWWQYELGRQMPILRLVWPVKSYQLVITDRGRLLMATYSAIGTLSDKKGFPKGGATLGELVEEKQGLAMKLNPLVPKDYKTFTGVLNLPTGPIKLCGVPGNFVDEIQGKAAATAPATA
jgi:hypothetical protein